MVLRFEGIMAKGRAFKVCRGSSADGARFSIRFLAIAGLAFTANAQLGQKYCSNLNTGSDFDKVAVQYQSNGRCHDTCLQEYAFAIVQGDSCWCSDYAPGETTSTSDCNQECPGYGFESCGSSSNNLYGYIALNKQPAGTQGAPSPSEDSSEPVSSQTLLGSSDPPDFSSSFLRASTFTTSFVQLSASLPIAPSPSQPLAPSTPFSTSSHTFSEPQTSTVQVFQFPSTSLSSRPAVLTNPVQSTFASPSSVTVIQTVTESLVAASSSRRTSTSTTLVVTKTRARITPSTTSASTTTAAASTSSTWTPTPVISVETVIGELRTVTLTPTEPPQATTPLQQTSSNPGFWSNAGRVAGLFVGLALIILLVAGTILFCCWRRRRRNGDILESAAGDSTPPRTRSRSVSELGLISDDRPAMGERSLPKIQTAGTWGDGTASASSPASMNDRRSSLARIIDQRLDPASLWHPGNDNSSRISVRSLQDDQDYSRRVLRLANPDR